MDHRISKDMISSGMIPSGEKNQEDLGKTQYGTVPSPNALSDVYKKMYETKEEVINEHHKKDADGNTIPHEDEEIKEGKMPAGLQAYLDKKKGKKEVKEEIDTYDIVLDPFLNEGYEREDILKVMSTVNLTEEPITATLAAIGTGLMKGAAVAAKGAMGAVKAGGTALKSGMKGVVSAAKGGISSVKSGMKGVTNAAKNVTKPKVTSSGGKIEQGSSNTAGNKIKDFAKREAGNMVRQQLMKDREVSGTNKTAMATAAKTDVAASADLFDIVKGKLLDEGLSEDEALDIMLTLPVDEILKEIEESSMSAGSSGGNYHDGGDGVFRSKEQIGNMFNKNIPTKKQTGNKVDKMTRKSINTSAKELGIQGPSTLKQSVEPEGETI